MTATAATGVPPRRWPRVPLAGVACLGAAFVTFADGTSVAVLRPDIANALSTSAAETSWIVNAFLLALVALVVPAGAVAARVGEVRMLRLGSALFTIGAVLVAGAGSATMLIAGRALMGAGAGTMLPPATAQLRALAPPGRQAMVMATFAAASTGGGALGPLAAGAIAELASWRVSLLVAAATAGLVCVASFVSRPSHQRGTISRGTRTLIGVNLVFGVGLSAIVWALIRIGQVGWGDGAGLAAFAAGAAVLVANAAWIAQRRARWTGRYAVPALLSLVSVTAAGNVGMLSSLVLLSTFLQQVQGRPALEAGIALLPFLATATVFTPLGGRLTSTLAPRVQLALGCSVQLIGLLGLTQLSATSSYLAIGVPLVVMGVGTGLSIPASLPRLMATAPVDRGAFMGGLSVCSNQVGGLIGIALLDAGRAVDAGSVVSSLQGAAAAGAFALVLCLVLPAIPRRPHVA